MTKTIKTQTFNLAGCPVFTVQLEDFSPRDIMNSGQVFRLSELEPGLFEVITRDRRLYFTEGEDHWFNFFCSRQEFNDFWHDYFDLGTDYSKFRETISPNDWFLKDAAEYGKNLKILRQDPWEMLITFLLTQRKSLPSIRNSIHKLCLLAGSQRTDCSGSYYAFPTPKQLAALSEEQLKSCGLGYRTPYIEAAARAVRDGEIDFERIENIDNRSAMEELKKLPGVGDKVAQCILLFGLHRLDAFPSDVWIKRVADDFYGGHFPVEQHQGHNGVMQQYLFHYGRNSYYKQDQTKNSESDNPDAEEE